MKLHRFTAPNNQQAMLKVHQQLGADALIYSTKKVGGEIEIMAGMPGVESTNTSEIATIEMLTQHLRILERDVKQISNKVTQDYYEENERNNLYYYLGKLGFRGIFRKKFVEDFIINHDLRDGINDELIENKLIESLKTDEYELIETQNVCALVGPTGAGKTTSIIKIAKRYAGKYNLESLGIITTDYHNATEKSILKEYCDFFGVTLEYANTPEDLSDSIEKLNRKSFILIDTNGAGFREKDKIDVLLGLQKKYDGSISSYLTLPCNIQEPILNEIVKSFSGFNLAGCILTKADESIGLAPVINVCLNNNLNVSYLCNGQNTNTDISAADAGEIIYEIISSDNIQAKSTHENIARNMRRIASISNEIRQTGANP